MLLTSALLFNLITGTVEASGTLSSISDPFPDNGNTQDASCNNGTYHQTNSNFSNYGTTYWWNVTVNDGTTNTSATYPFTTIGMPNVTYVDDDFNESTPDWNVINFSVIQDAVDAVVEGGTVYVYNGTYNEEVTVNKTLDLIGEDKNGTFVNGTDYGFTITADWVNLSGFSVYDALNYPIYLIDSSHCVIFDCDLYDSYETIVVLEADTKDCSYNVITECEIFEGDRLVAIWAWGDPLMNVSYNQIHNNTMHTCNQFGFEIYYAYNNTIRDNTIIHYPWAEGGGGPRSDNAIYLWGSHYNNIINNEISNWDASAIYFETYADSGGYCNYTVISGNDIVNNSVGIEIWAGENNSFYYNNFNNTHNAFDNSTTNNNWSTNWWENYDEPSEGAWDNNTDGYADDPYDIPGIAGAQDPYPLMNPWGTPPKQAPTVITNDSTDFEETNATLHAYLQDDGGETCTVWFEYGNTTDYGINTSNQTKSTGQTFTANVSKLIRGQLYHFRAYANNTVGSSIGSDKTFLTKPGSPSGLIATASSSSQINLAWAKGNGTNNTYIVRKIGSYPNSRTDGTIVYNSTGTNHSDQGLNSATTYYYQAWSYSSWNSLHQWSDAYVNDTCTTASNGGEEPPGGSSPPQPPSPEEELTTKERIEELFNITLLLNFSAYDTDEDGIVDTFSDPNGILEPEHYVILNDNASFLISVYNDLGKLFILDAEADTITLVTHTIGAITADVKDNKNKTRIVSVTIEKTDWVYIEVTDQYPSYPLLNVQTSDGRNISTDMIWREQDKIFVLDDPEREYQFVYSSKKKGFLFDVLLELTPTSVDVGDNINALITLINVGEPGQVNGSISFALSGEEVVWQEEENVSVLGQKAFSKTIATEGLRPGEYTFKIIYNYGDNQTTSAEGSFTVNAYPPSEEIPLWVLIVMAVITVVVVVFLFWYFKIK